MFAPIYTRVKSGSHASTVLITRVSLAFHTRVSITLPLKFVCARMSHMSMHEFHARMMYSMMVYLGEGVNVMVRE